MIKVRQILEDAERVEDVENKTMALVISTENEDLVEGVVIGEGEDPRNRKALFLREITDLDEEVDFENDLFFLLSREVWDGAKNSKILFNHYEENKGKDEN